MEGPSLSDSTGQPLENTAIVEAMHNVALHDGEDTRALLYQLLLESTLVVATPDAPETASVHTAGAGENITLSTMQEGDDIVLPVFTSVRTLLEWRPEGGGYAAMPAQAIFEMVAGGQGTIALDPASPTHGTVTRNEIAALARRRLPLGGAEVITEPTAVMIGHPAQPPPESTLAAVTDAVAAEPTATDAWLYLMQQGTGPGQMMIAVQLRPEVQGDDERAAMRRIIDAAGSRDEGVRELAFLRPHPDLAASLADGAGRTLFHR
jgi:hypothetical protein